MGFRKHECSNIACDILRAPADPLVRPVRAPQPEGRLSVPPRAVSPLSPVSPPTAPQAPSICTRVPSAQLPSFHVTQAELENPHFLNVPFDSSAIPRTDGEVRAEREPGSGGGLII